jgi:short-subunit dehydrogenase
MQRVRDKCKCEEVYLVQIDLTKPEECLERLKTIGKVDILINNGGISMREEFKDMEFATC